MKLSIKQKNRLKATKIFIGREELRASFWEKYHYYKANIDNDESDIQVLSFYGIGGIGKSSLIQELRKEITEQIPEPKFVTCDFSVVADMRAILDSMAKNLKTSYDFKFPLFDYANCTYDCKVNGECEKTEYHGYIDKHTDKLKEIKAKEPQELYEYLPVLFAQDLNDNLEDAKEPLVVFLDTYEELDNEMRNKGFQANNDWWLRGNNGVISKTASKVLWVIAGREKLIWEEYDKVWEGSLEQHILGNLSFEESEEFLINAGIEAADLRQEIYKLTIGLPAYLDLCVDRCVESTERGIEPNVEEFKKDTYGLSQRFVRNMDNCYKDIVYMLSCLQTWDDQMVEKIGPKVIPNFNLITYAKVNNLSMVYKSCDGNYCMHQVVADVLFNDAAIRFKERIAEFASEYCQMQLQEHNVLDSKYHYHLNWLMKFGLRNFAIDEFVDKFFKKYIVKSLDELFNSSQFSIAEGICMPFLKLALNYDESSNVGKVALWIRSEIETKNTTNKK